jgi:predicted DNA-binding transcriptional regulator AlpA
MVARVKLKHRPVHQTNSKQEQNPTPSEFMRKRQLAKTLGVSWWSIDTWRRKNAFPAPFWLSKTTPVWKYSEVMEWLAKRQAPTAGEIEQ